MSNEGEDSSNSELKAILVRIEQQLSGLSNGVWVPEGRAISARLTVAIILKDTPRQTATGHGLLIRQGESYYLLTAAHVVVSLKPEMLVIFKFKDGSLLEAKFGEGVYLPKDYLRTGNRDIGMIQVLSEELATLPSCQIKMKENPVGSLLVGDGKQFLQGTCVGMSEGNDSRFLCHGISVPGCSGSPLFDGEKSLCGILHGFSKHTNRHSADLSGIESERTPSFFGDVALNTTLVKIKFEKKDEI